MIFQFIVLYDVTFGAKAAWIGLHAKEENAPYMWTDMTPLDFVYWEDDIFSPNPDGDPCVYRDFSVDVYGRGDWIAYNCSDPSITGYGYVCQLSF
uniref:C-type lectin domain-containing protein n=1 Tax=Acrobeloides nanus TaxID=290746 RepID=A0A914D459_9BILA